MAIWEIFTQQWVLLVIHHYVHIQMHIFKRACHVYFMNPIPANEDTVFVAMQQTDDCVHDQTQRLGLQVMV